MSYPSERMRLKDKIIANIAKAIKAIQDYQFYNGQESGAILSNSDWQCHKLCENLDHALLHGLRNVTHGYWRMVTEFMRKGATKEIERIQNVTTDLGRGRAWIFLALNENLLESYLKCIIDSPKFVKKFYVKEALVLDDQRMQLLLTLTSGLEMAVFQMDYDVPYLDLSTYPPRTRSKSSENRAHPDPLSQHGLAIVSDSKQSISAVETLASTPESSRGLTDSDSSSITSLDTNGGVTDGSRTGSLSVDSGCHLDTSSATWRPSAVTPTDSMSISSQGSNSEVEPRFRRIETIINPDEDGEESGLGLEVIRVKSKVTKAKSKKSKKSRLVDIPRTREVSEMAIPAASPNIEFVEAVILNSFKEELAQDVGTSPKSIDSQLGRAEQKDCVHVPDQRSRSPGDGEENRSHTRENPSVKVSKGDHSGVCHEADNRVTSPVSEAETKLGDGSSETVQGMEPREEEVCVVCDKPVDAEHSQGMHTRDIKYHHTVEENGLQACMPKPAGYLDSAIVFTSQAAELNGKESREEKYFIGLDEDEDFYKVRNTETVPDFSVDNPSKRQDYVDFIVGDSSDAKESEDIGDNFDISSFECREEDYSIQLNNNTLLCLMLDVFAEQDEQFRKLYCTCQSHTEGEVKVVFVLISDRAVYLLHQQDISKKFVKHADIPFKDIDFLALSVNNQIINLVCTNRRKQFWLTTGNETITKEITNTLSSAVQRWARSVTKLTVLSDATTQKICMKKYAARESRVEPDEVNIEGYSLVYWEDPNSRSSKSDTIVREGTLLFMTPDAIDGQVWRPVYVILRDGMLCVFEDQNASKPQWFVRLGGDQCVGCRRSTEREHCIEVILSRGRSWQFSAASDIEVADWLQSLCKSVSEGNLAGGALNYLPCCAVLTHQKILLCHEDPQTSFFRTLGSANVEDVTSITVDQEVRNYCILEFESQEASVSSEQWVLYFNSGIEMIRFTRAMSKSWEQQFQVDIPIGYLEDVPLKTQCQDTARHIQRLFTLREMA